METAAQKFISRLTNDNVMVTNKIVSLSTLVGMPVRKGMEQAVISDGTLVNTVSLQYGHLPNQTFFGEVERQLKANGVNYVTRSINRDNRSFVVDYILNDDTMTVNVKNGKDRILPMLRFTNSYDGSNQTSGHFGFFREVCTNGLHVAQTELQFKAKHRGNIIEVSMDGIAAMIQKFFENEYFSITKKFETMATKHITDVNAFVESVAKDLKLFQFEKSAKNAEPSLNAQLVIDTINREAKELNVTPNLWLGYNAFNELLHDKLKQTFDKQATVDAKMFDHILEMAN
jgi:hypothetical protein